ncbi:YlxR family protein [Microbacterium indicum]|uniref:YlxR family protein n=1 Tax=Microbacterium indicum TaxID=358100 RepID=UPI000A00D549
MEPVRTCVGCRTRAPRTALLRIAAIGSQLVVDERASMPGRGAWVHPSRDCMEIALQRRAFARALRVSPKADALALEEWLNSYGTQVNGSK